MMKKTAALVLAAAMLAACARPSDITVVNGQFGEDAPEGVLVLVPDLGIQEMTDVTDGTFTIELPTDVTVLGSIEYGFSSVKFVPDGTDLSIDFTEAAPVITSSKPKISVQEKFSALVADIDAIFAHEDIMDQGELEEAVINTCEEAIKNNPDNVVGLSAFATIYNALPYERLTEVLGWLKEPLTEKETVREVMSMVNSMQDTAEGNMFTDFSVVQDPDDPENSTVNFSDFIGKGKYVLVDFWASWCGPCRQEIPNIKAAYEKYAGEMFDILSIAVWDEPEDTKRAAVEEGIKWNQIINAQHIPTDIYNIDGIPHIILFGPDGTILKRNLRGSMIDSEIAKYVKPVK